MASRCGPEWVRAEISKILAENYARFAEPEPDVADELPEIVGKEKVDAGD